MAAATGGPRLRRATRLRDQLEQEIVTGRRRPGERLDETRLAVRFKVSRTPVREALLQLASTGLVELRPRRGAFVAESSVTSLVEMFELMAELEGACGRLAAHRITRPERERLREAHAACADAAGVGVDAYYYENERFHHVIYAAAHNAFLAAQTRALRVRLKPQRRLQLRMPDRVRNSLAEHQSIVEAILMGDGLRAETLLRAHILIQGERFADFVAAHDGAGIGEG